MVKAEANIFIKTPVEKVFGFLLETEKLPEWMPLLVEVYDIQGKGVGQTYKWTYKFMGIKFEGSNEIIELLENKKTVTKSKAGIDSIWTFTLEKEGDGTKVDLLVEYTVPIPVLGKFAENYVVKKSTQDMQQALESLKHVLET